MFRLTSQTKPTAVLLTENHSFTIWKCFYNKAGQQVLQVLTTQPLWHIKWEGSQRIFWAELFLTLTCKHLVTSYWGNESENNTAKHPTACDLNQPYRLVRSL